MMITWYSKHIEACNKRIVKQKFCASSWLNSEINILRCTVSKTINILRCTVSKTINILRCTVSKTTNILRRTVSKTSKNTCLVLTLVAVRSFTDLDYDYICHVILMAVMSLWRLPFYFEYRHITLMIVVLLWWSPCYFINRHINLMIFMLIWWRSCYFMVVMLLW